MSLSGTPPNRGNFTRQQLARAPAILAATWAGWLGILVGILASGAAVALAVFGVPVGVRLAASIGAGGFVVGIGGRLCLDVLGLDWWPVAVLALVGLVVVGVVGLVVLARRWTFAHAHAWDFGRGVAGVLERISPAERQASDDASRAAQGPAVFAINNRILARP